MTEDESRDWIGAHYGSSGVAAMQRIVELVVAENAVQNLIAPSTLTSVWNRHIVDSAQLIGLVEGTSTDRPWIDIGSGAGFPGLVVAALGRHPVCLVEPRRRRVAFLTAAVNALGLAGVTIICGRIEQSRKIASVISARAVAQLPELLEWASLSSDASTRWVLPKGRGALEEIERARAVWHGVFHVERSITDPDSLIVIASGVARR